MAISRRQFPSRPKRKEIPRALDREAPRKDAVFHLFLRREGGLIRIVSRMLYRRETGRTRHCEHPLGHAGRIVGFRRHLPRWRRRHGYNHNGDARDGGNDNSVATDNAWTSPGWRENLPTSLLSSLPPGTSLHRISRKTLVRHFFFFPPLAWRRVDANVKWITEKHKGFPFSAIRCPAAVLRLNLFRTFLLRPQRPKLRDDVSLVVQAVLTQFETLYVL